MLALPPLRHPAPPWPLAAGLASAALLAGAHAFERFGGLAPCALCLHQREAHWVTLCIGMAGYVALYLRPTREAASAISVLLGAGFLAGAVLAGFHVGVELKLWPGLPECSIGTMGELNGRDLLASLSRPQEVVRCDEVPWSFAGLSMAGWNALISAGLGLASLRAAFTGGKVLPGLGI